MFLCFAQKNACASPDNLVIMNGKKKIYNHTCIQIRVFALVIFGINSRKVSTFLSNKTNVRDLYCSSGHSNMDMARTYIVSDSVNSSQTYIVCSVYVHIIWLTAQLST